MRYQTRLAVLLVSIAALNHSATWAQHEHHQGSLSVPPADELLIIHPEVDPEGKPRPVFVPHQDGGVLDIQIPPTVIVHRYYYTGNREFQGPLIPGGPTVIVASHPTTGEQIAIEAQLLPGAPRIRYGRHEICYIYSEKRISVCFGKLPFVDTKVVISDIRARRRSQQASVHLVTALKSLSRRSGLSTATHQVGQGAQQGVSAVADRVHGVGEIVSRPIVSLWQATPLEGLLTPDEVPRTPPRIDSRGIVDEFEGTFPTNR